MAIQKNITDMYGITHAAAYVRINNISIGNPSIIDVLVYTNAAARSKGVVASEKRPILSLMYTIRDADEISTILGDAALKGDGKSPLTSVYTWLKTVNDSISSRDSDRSPLDGEEGIDWTTGTSDV